MKYCIYCGEQLADEAVMCPKCGRMVNCAPATPQPAQSGSSTNVLCLVGFILSFLTGIVGLILCIVGYNQVKNGGDGTSKTLAKAGIIISAVKLGIGALIIVFYLNIFAVLFGTSLAFF